MAARWHPISRSPDRRPPVPSSDRVSLAHQHALYHHSTWTQGPYWLLQLYFYTYIIKSVGCNQGLGFYKWFDKLDEFLYLCPGYPSEYLLFIQEPRASRTALLAKFSDAISSRPYICLCFSFLMMENTWNTNVHKRCVSQGYSNDCCSVGKNA